MKKKKQTRDLYNEDLIYMSYRYAIGLETQKEEPYFNVEFNSPEFYALANEFKEFLQSKGISTIKEIVKHKDDDLVYLSSHYACGRHSFATLHAHAIANQIKSTMSNERIEFFIKDMRNEIWDKLSWVYGFKESDYTVKGKFCPLNLFFEFINQYEVTSLYKLAGYKFIEPTLDKANGRIEYANDWSKEKADNDKYMSTLYLEDLIPWANLCNALDTNSHASCKVHYNGEDKNIESFVTYARDYSYYVYWDDILHDVENRISCEFVSYNDCIDVIKELEAKYKIPSHDIESWYGGIKEKSDLIKNLYKAYCDIRKPETEIHYKKLYVSVEEYFKNPSDSRYIAPEYIVEVV